MRYLIRFANRDGYTSENRESIAERIREAVNNGTARAVNVRVAGPAVEFDLFADSEAEVRAAVTRLRPFGEILTVRRLDGTPPKLPPKEEVLHEARRLFNEERFWEVHETLEDLWRRESGAERDLLQGLILFAAAYVHQQRARYPRVLPVLERAMGKLRGSSLDRYGPFDLTLIRAKGESYLMSGQMTPFHLPD